MGAVAQFEGPYALVVDQATHLAYIADGAAIRVMTPTGEVSTLVGSNSAYLSYHAEGMSGSSSANASQTGVGYWL